MKKFALTILAVGLAIQIGISSDKLDRSAADLRSRAQAVLAQTSGRIELDGLQKPVEVIRDRWGVAHIYAETQEDLFFAQGFVAAQDRLWQMEIWRRTGEGKLAEVLGESAIERDKFARLMRYRGNMEAEWQTYSRDAKQIIESFVRGVNAFIETSRDRLPIEFELTGIKPEPWTPEVCLTRMAGYVMTRNAAAEVLRAQLAKRFGPGKVDLWIETDPFKKLEVPAGLDLTGIDEKILAGAKAASAPVSFSGGASETSSLPSAGETLAQVESRARTEGSNNWVVSGALSATGKPILANDPHRPILLPSLRYMVHLVGPGWNVIGAGEPTLPGVAAGHNERVGFGFTIVGIDQQDLYVERIRSNYPTVYRYMNKWLRMRVEREKINVKGTEPVEVELKFTRHGPVIYEDPELNRAYALKWIGSEPGSAGYLASLSLNRATNWPEFLKALERWKVPSENLVYADIDGNIGWQAAGAAPVRRGWSGLLPVPGDSGRYEWDGFLPLSELPRAYNPAKNFIATANHKVIPEGYKHEINFEWAAPYRFNRIEEVLGKGSKLTVEDFKRLQHDEASLPARELVPLLKGRLAGFPVSTQRASRLVLGWDGVLAKDSAGAAIFEMWIQKLGPKFADRILPAGARVPVGSGALFTRMIRALKNPDAKLFGANAQGKARLLISMSFAEAVTELRARFGPDMKKWRWGNLHIAEFKHPLATDDATRSVLDLKSVARGGDGNTVNATSGSKFIQKAGASFREILDLSDWDNSVAINVPGQSGQPASPHYGDLLPLWVEGKYFPMLFSRDKVEKNAAARLVLEPRAGAQR